MNKRKETFRSIFDPVGPYDVNDFMGRQERNEAYISNFRALLGKNPEELTSNEHMFLRFNKLDMWNMQGKSK